ncbi:alpha-D-ribose 1-methylphosphonate 5-triphosphate diphosphatase [Cognatishimia sp. WU-CL00825]
MQFRLTGAQVLVADTMQNQELNIADGVISDQQQSRDIDLSGFAVLPAIVDIHGDGFERHLAPRRGAMKDLGQGLISADAELASNGIATAILAQFYSWEGGMRGPEFATRFLKAHDTAKRHMLTDTRIQLRFETHMLDHYAAFETLVAQHQIPYVVFNDHLPHAALAKGKRPPRLTGQALKGGRNPEAHLALLQALYARRADVPDALAALAARLTQSNICLGSHDDATRDQRQAFQAMGLTLSEFPETSEAAKATHEFGGHIILGAPNVVRGGSHSGNVAAQDLIANGLCDALASDYHYPALRQAAFKLSDEAVLSFAKAWALVSSGPAKLLGLTDRGTLDNGKRADLIVLDPNTRRIEATFSKGHVTYLTGQAAQRFLA